MKQLLISLVPESHHAALKAIAGANGLSVQAFMRKRIAEIVSENRRITDAAGIIVEEVEDE